MMQRITATSSGLRSLNKFGLIISRAAANIGDQNKPAELDTAYVPKSIEQDGLLQQDYFHSDKKSSKPFTLILPPPNITGILHLGHALTVTIEDVLVKWHRMRGYETVWIPGIDHAGIATQVVVEKRLWKEKRKTRHELGREAFEKEVWKWKEEKAKVIGQQLRRMGASLDWSREMFTMDPAQSRAVTAAFVKLHERGLIYRSDYPVNWSCVLQSAISDVEVEHLEVHCPTDVHVAGYAHPVRFGVLFRFAYKICDSDDEIVVATTRPETMLGDVAIAVHPNDERYSDLIGKEVWHPFRKEAIPIIADSFVVPNFGTGAVKISPAHDRLDFEVGKRHRLDVLQVIDELGNLNASCGEFAGLPRFDARDVIVAELGRLNLMRGQEDHKTTVPICGRSKDVVEFLLKDQWFVKCEDMAARALEDVQSGKLVIDPPQFTKNWTDWLENIRDWCVSRQLWWGHRIPAFFCHVRGQDDRTSCVVAENEEVSRIKAAERLACPREEIISQRDGDVLDTWFSSALLPFTAFGWPQQTGHLHKYYPLSLMETGNDILFFWVARMVMLGTELTGQLPFSKILLHGIVCDANGRKMSKSLGNVIAPEYVISGASLKDLEKASLENYQTGILTSKELKRATDGQKKMFPEGIPECGSDALRFTLCSHNIKNHFVNFDVQECKINKFFGNKIWQAVRFSNKWTQVVSEAQKLQKVDRKDLTKMDKWVLSRLSMMTMFINEGLQKHDFYIATAAIKNFMYYDLCDIYLETAKRGLRNPDGETAAGHCWTLGVCLDNGLRSLFPFMPRLAQHLHERLSLHPFAERRFDYPQELPWRDEELENDVDSLMEVVTSVRRLKKLFGVTGKHKPEVTVVTERPFFCENSRTLQDLAACHSLTVAPGVGEEFAKDAVSDRVGDVAVHLLVPGDLRQAFDVDVGKLAKRKEKLTTELDKIKKITATADYKLKVSPKGYENDLKKIALLEEKLARIHYIQSMSKE